MTEEEKVHKLVKLSEVYFNFFNEAKNKLFSLNAMLIGAFLIIYQLDPNITSKTFPKIVAILPIVSMVFIFFGNLMILFHIQKMTKDIKNNKEVNTTDTRYSILLNIATLLTLFELAVLIIYILK